MLGADTGMVGWIRRTIRKQVPTFLGGFAFSVLCFFALNAAMVPVSKSEYCGGKCHEMSKAYRTWELSSHGANAVGIRAECIDCHLPPKDAYFAHVAAKAYTGAKDIYKHYFGPEYDPEGMRKKVLDHMSNEMCLHCHDALLAKPGSSAARIAHVAALAEPDAPEHRCIQCHENAGHQRQTKLFSQ
jgi:cytochrome c-type protein NapC/trimethylamine-N-oxide reductase cytochrome c-type subunit TorC